MMGMGFGFVFMIVFWMIVIGLAVGLLSVLFPRMKESLTARDEGVSQNPTEILKGRYARGEISKTEYEEMRKVLKSE